MGLPRRPSSVENITDLELVAALRENGMIDEARERLSRALRRPIDAMKGEIAEYVHQTLYGDDENLREALLKFVVLCRLSLDWSVSDIADADCKVKGGGW